MREICVVTHTQATHHVERKVGGWYNSALTDKGEADAQLCGLRLADLGWTSVPIFSSDLRRARETAHELANCLDSSVQYDARLREMSFGTAEGKSTETIPPILSSCGADRLDFRNEFGGETKRELATRIYAAMGRLPHVIAPSSVRMDTLQRFLLPAGFACLSSLWAMSPSACHLAASHGCRRTIYEATALSSAWGIHPTWNDERLKRWRAS